MAKTTSPVRQRTPRSTPIPPDSGEPPAVETVDNAEKIERFAIPLDPKTGQIVLENMRDASREKLTKAIASTPGLASQSGTGSDVSEFNTVIATVLYDAISSIAMVTARSRGFSASSAELLRYTEQEKAQFVGPTVAVLDKYDLLKSKYKEEIALLAIVGTVTGSKIMAMQRAEAAIVRAATPAPAPPLTFPSSEGPAAS